MTSGCPAGTASGSPLVSPASCSIRSRTPRRLGALFATLGLFEVIAVSSWVMAAIVAISTIVACATMEIEEL